MIPTEQTRISTEPADGVVGLRRYAEELRQRLLESPLGPDQIATHLQEVGVTTTSALAKQLLAESGQLWDALLSLLPSAVRLVDELSLQLASARHELDKSQAALQRALLVQAMVSPGPSLEATIDDEAQKRPLEASSSSSESSEASRASEAPLETTECNGEADGASGEPTLALGEESPKPAPRTATTNAELLAGLMRALDQFQAAIARLLAEPS